MAAAKRARAKTQKKGAKKPAAKKRTVTAKTAATATATAKPNAVMDIRDPKDISKLTNLIKKNKVTFVLVYADWCGHCKTFKQDVWSKLTGLPNRKVPLAQVNADVLPSTPLKSVKIDGYPSVVPIGNDMKPATFKGEDGTVTNSLPNARNMPMMEKLVTADPAKVLSASTTTAGTTTIAVENLEEDDTMEEGTIGPEPTPTLAEEAGDSEMLTEAAENAREEDADNSMNVNSDGSVNVPSGPAGTVISNPPDTEDDLMSSQSQPVNTAVPLNSKGNTQKGGGGGMAAAGGSLFSDLVAFIKSNGGSTRRGGGRKQKLRPRVTTRRR